jgi:hypothetical protein
VFTKEENLELCFKKAKCVTYEQLMTCRVINDFGLFVLIWLVQLIIYPSFEFTAASRFASWHLKYTGLITVFVVPLMFAQVGLLAWENSLFFSWKSATGAILVVSCWLVTFTLSVPTHSKLQAIGNDLETVRWLVLTNWPRTICWSLVLLLSLQSWWRGFWE